MRITRTPDVMICAPALMWFELQDNEDENQNQFLAGGLKTNI